MRGGRVKGRLEFFWKFIHFGTATRPLFNRLRELTNYGYLNSIKHVQWTRITFLDKLRLSDHDWTGSASRGISSTNRTASPLRRHQQQGRSLIMDDRAIHGFGNQTGTWTHGRTYPWSWFQTFRNFPVVRCLSHKNWNIISSPCFTEQQLKSYVTWQFVETISLPRRVDFSTSQPFPAHLLLIQPAWQETSLFFTNHSLQQLLFNAQS